MKGFAVIHNAGRSIRVNLRTGALRHTPPALVYAARPDNAAPAANASMQSPLSLTDSIMMIERVRRAWIEATSSSHLSEGTACELAVHAHITCCGWQAVAAGDLRVTQSVKRCWRMMHDQLEREDEMLLAEAGLAAA